MYSVKLEINDNVFDKVIYFLQNLPKNEVKVDIVKEIKNDDTTQIEMQSELNAYSNHSANTIDEWKDSSEDDIWK
jgi:hypothetical protein